jgi:hypothetical protein
MSHERKQISLLARLLVAKYGQRAPAVAAERVRLWTEAADRDTADLWRAVAETIVKQLARPRHEPSLSEVLVEAAIFAAPKKRQRTARRSRRTFKRSSRRRTR